MTRPKKTATLLTTLSVRLDDATFARLVAASQRERRTLSDYVRLLVERCQTQHTA
jgi:predicted DNA-binding protein